MARKIDVKIKNNYGQHLVYPVCEDAKIFSVMTGTRTLTPSTLLCISSLGFKIEVKGYTELEVQKMMDNKWCNLEDLI